MNTPSPMIIEGFFDPKTSTVSDLLLDTLFMPDYGTARCDFPGGDARALYLKNVSRERARL